MFDDPADRMEFYESIKYNHMKARSRYVCDNCNEFILEGDRFLEYDNLILCDECIRYCTRYA